MKASVRYECIGGPFDGKLMDRPQVRDNAFAVIGKDVSGRQMNHIYRLCLVSKKVRGKVLTARFWHYVGEDPRNFPEPTLRAPRRLYKAEKH